MTALAIHSEVKSILLPIPRNGAINIRLALPGAADLKFVDDLQRKHARMVGWFPTKQMEAYIARGQVLVAEEIGTSTLRVESPDAERRASRYQNK